MYSYRFHRKCCTLANYIGLQCWPSCDMIDDLTGTILLFVSFLFFSLKHYLISRVWAFSWRSSSFLFMSCCRTLHMWREKIQICQYVWSRQYWCGSRWASCGCVPRGTCWLSAGEQKTQDACPDSIPANRSYHTHLYFSNKNLLLQYSKMDCSKWKKKISLYINCSLSLRFVWVAWLVSFWFCIMPFMPSGCRFPAIPDCHSRPGHHISGGLWSEPRRAYSRKESYCVLYKPHHLCCVMGMGSNLAQLGLLSWRDDMCLHSVLPFFFFFFFRSWSCCAKKG